MVHFHRNQKQSFSSDRALNPSISEHDQVSLWSEKVQDLSRPVTRKLSSGSMDGEESVAAKTPVATRTPRFTPAKNSTQRRQTVSPKVTTVGSNCV